MNRRHKFRAFTLPIAALSLALCALASPAQAQSAAAGTRDASLYNELGGKENIRKFTHELITILVVDPRTKDQFEDADLDRLEGFLEEQFCDLSGGPCTYSGKDMTRAHEGKNINQAQFNALAEDLQIAMEHAGVPNRAANKLVAKLAPMFHSVVSK